VGVPVGVEVGVVVGVGVVGVLVGVVGVLLGVVGVLVGVLGVLLGVVGVLVAVVGVLPGVLETVGVDAAVWVGLGVGFLVGLWWWPRWSWCPGTQLEPAGLAAAYPPTIKVSTTPSVASTETRAWRRDGAGRRRAAL
jgi:hypothetical protein